MPDYTESIIHTLEGDALKRAACIVTLRKRGEE